MVNPNILFVDDDVLNQWLLTEILVDAGYQVTSACRGMEALRLLQDMPGFDLLLTDVDLPDALSGTDIGQRWQAVLPGRPTVYMGAHRPLATRHLAPHEFFLNKPVEPASLMETVEYALRGAYAAALPRLASLRPIFMH